MPVIRSKRQWRWCKAAEARGELPKGSCKRGLEESGKSLSELPESVGGKTQRGRKTRGRKGKGRKADR